jgi:hypothetical protein
MISPGLSLITKHLRKSVDDCKSIRICIFFGALLLNGCAGPTTFRVLDAETKEPVEGAVAIAMWDRTRGMPGLSSTYTAKAVEAESDADGFFRIPGVVGTLALQKPHLKVYKPGYVGWDSRKIYVGCYESNQTIPILREREKFTMTNQDLYLESWKEEYSFISHESFIQTRATNLSKAGLEESKYENAIRYELPLAIREETFERRGKSMNKKSSFLAIVIFMSSNWAVAFDDKITHPTLTRTAVEHAVYLENAIKVHLGMEEGLGAELFNGRHNFTITKWLEEGSREEDDPRCRAVNHFHDPTRPWSEAMLTDSTLYADLRCALTPYHTKYSNLVWATGFIDQEQTPLEPPVNNDPGLNNGRNWSVPCSLFV